MSLTGIWGAVAGAGSNLLGNWLGYRSTKKTNQTNMNIAQMNNEFNERMLQKEMDYNQNMWQMQFDKTNAYNDPSAQKARLIMAGFNPYMALGQITAGTAQSSSVTGVHTPTASPVTMQPFTPDFGGIGQAIQTYAAQRLQDKAITADIGLKEQQEEQIRIDNKYSAAKAIEMIDNLKQDAHGKSLKNEFQKIQNSFAEDMFSSDIKYKDRQIQALEADIRVKDVEVALKEIQVSNLPKQYQLTFASIAADTLLKKSNLNLSNANIELVKRQTSHELQKEFKTTAEKLHINLNNINLQKMCKAIVEKAIQETLGDDYKLPVGTRNWFDLKKRRYGELPGF